jgi:hypothetical protein
MKELRTERVDRLRNLKYLKDKIVNMEKELRARKHSPRQSAVPTEPDIFGIFRHFGNGDGKHRWLWRTIWRHFFGQGVRLEHLPICKRRQ